MFVKSDGFFFCEQKVWGKHVHVGKITSHNIILCTVRTCLCPGTRGPATEVERSMSMVAIFSSRPPPSINKRQSGPERRPRLASSQESGDLGTQGM